MHNLVSLWVFFRKILNWLKKFQTFLAVISLCFARKHFADYLQQASNFNIKWTPHEFLLFVFAIF